MYNYVCTNNTHYQSLSYVFMHCQRQGGSCCLRPHGGVHQRRGCTRGVTAWDSEGSVSWWKTCRPWVFHGCLPPKMIWRGENCRFSVLGVRSVPEFFDGRNDRNPLHLGGKRHGFPVDLIFPKINAEKRTIFLRLQQSSRVLIPFAFAAKYPRIFFQDEFWTSNI